MEQTYKSSGYEGFINLNRQTTQLIEDCLYFSDLNVHSPSGLIYPDGKQVYERTQEGLVYRVHVGMLLHQNDSGPGHFAIRRFGKASAYSEKLLAIMNPDSTIRKQVQALNDALSSMH